MARSILALAFTACAANMGGPREVVLDAIGLRAESSTTPEAAAEALQGVDFALVAAPQDFEWFRQVVEHTSLQLSGPAESPEGLSLAFFGTEPLGDTAITLSYPGGTFVVQDALYQLPDDQFLDLLAFRVGQAADARPFVASLLEYVATDVMANAAVIVGVAVPSAEAGDSVARMFSPGYTDAARCEAGGIPAQTTPGIRLFYGPEALIRCRSAAAESAAAGRVVRSTLVVGGRP